jgi:CBS domain-containing protein
MNVAILLREKGSDVVTLPADRSIAEAVKLLAERRIGAVLVTGGDGRMIGILSERDIVWALAKSGPGILDAAVADHMSRSVETTTAGEAIHSIMERMTNGRFRHVPVLDADTLVGIVSIGDVVKHRLAEMEAETEALREYITT